MNTSFETTWPAKDFAQFGGHVLERLFNLNRECAAIEDGRRFKVTVRIEVEPIDDELTGNVSSAEDRIAEKVFAVEMSKH